MRQACLPPPRACPTLGRRPSAPTSTGGFTGTTGTGRALATSIALALTAIGALAPSAPAARPERAPAAAPPVEAGPRVPASTRSARRDLRERLGAQALLATDRRRGTVRALARLDGFLTGPSDRDGAEIARAYVLEHADVFGLDAGDLAALDMTLRYRDPSGIEHIVWAQTYRGVPAIDSSLRANLTAGGRIVNVTGGPVGDLAVPTTEPAVSAERAHEIAAAGLARASGVRSAGDGPTRPTEFESGDRAELAIFDERLAWRVFVGASSTEYYDTLVDARTGGVLRRENRVKFVNNASVFENSPGAAQGGTLVTRDLDPFLPPRPAQLEGPFAHAFVDRDDSVPGPGFNVFDVPASQETGQQPPGSGNFLHPFSTENCASPCDSWNPAEGNPAQADSWNADANHSATQLFFHVNRFHDHLAAAPIGFTSGNFEDGDKVVAQAMDGANGPGGVPDVDHVNNANMTTLPDGFTLAGGTPVPGLMQMYLWGGEPGVRAVDGSDDASIVYHEYTHGLNNRLVRDPQGFGALGSIQSGAIDEAQADWYAEDFLHAQGLESDAAGQGDVVLGSYPVPGGIRFQALDCEAPPSPVVAACPAPPGGAGGGGYTYGDFGRVAGIPEVHSDGEIWAQTLWDLRRAVGSADARLLVTNAMRLVPPEPSFLDMRNAILQADTNNGGGDRAAIWTVFGLRGMGYFSSTVDAADTAPIEDFTQGPPAGGATATLSGTVRDAGTGAPLAGARVSIGGHDTGVGEDFTATTAGDGSYSIPGVPQGTYPRVMFEAPGFDRAVETAVAVPGTRDVALRRNFALASGGATIASFTGPDYTQFGCGPGGLIDGSGGVVWGSDSPRHPQRPGPKEVVVRLPQAITLAEVQIDPSAGCGDDPQSSLGPFGVDVSSDGATFTQVASGTFGPANNGRANVVTLSSAPSGVQFVRLRALDSQATSGTGNAFMDVAELKVFAPPAPPAPAPAPAAPAAPTAPANLAPPRRVRLRFLTRRATMRRDGAFLWRIAGRPGARGRVTFTATVPRRGRRALRVRLASRRFTIPRSGRLTLRVRPSRAALRRLRRLRTVRVRASVRLAGERPQSSAFTLRLRRRR